jgi:hypothetical protein
MLFGKKCQGGPLLWILLFFYLEASYVIFCLQALPPPIYFLVDGTWGGWTPWSPCMAACGSGEKIRNRTCNQPLNGGRNCEGKRTETAYCHSGKRCSGNLMVRLGKVRKG